MRPFAPKNASSCDVLTLNSMVINLEVWTFLQGYQIKGICFCINKGILEEITKHVSWALTRVNRRGLARQRRSRCVAQEISMLRCNWREFPNAVGCINGTPHEILRPDKEPQWQFYSGHRHYHLTNTQ